MHMKVKRIGILSILRVFKKLLLCSFLLLFYRTSYAFEYRYLYSQKHSEVLSFLQRSDTMKHITFLMVLFFSFSALVSSEDARVCKHGFPLISGGLLPNLEKCSLVLLKIWLLP